MTKHSKKHPRSQARSERKSSHERQTSVVSFSRLKGLSKRFLHNYVIPMTRIIEHRLQRLEQSL